MHHKLLKLMYNMATSLEHVHIKREEKHHVMRLMPYPYVYELVLLNIQVKSHEFPYSDSKSHSPTRLKAYKTLWIHDQFDNRFNL